MSGPALALSGERRVQLLIRLAKLPVAETKLGGARRPPADHFRSTADVGSELACADSPPLDSEPADQVTHGDRAPLSGGGCNQPWLRSERPAGALHELGNGETRALPAW